MSRVTTYKRNRALSRYPKCKIPTFFARKLLISFIISTAKNLYIVNPRTDKAKKISAKAFRKSAKAYRIFYFRCITSLILTKIE